MRVSELIEILPGNTPVTVQTIHVSESSSQAVREVFDGLAKEARQRTGRLDGLRVIEATVRGLPAGNGIMTIIAMEADEDDDGGDQANR